MQYISRSFTMFAMAGDDLNVSCGWEAKPLTITPPKQKPERGQRPALPSRSRSFLKATPHTPEEEAEVKQAEEEEGEVSQAHEAVVVDLQAWQARGLVNAMDCNDKAWAGDNLVVGALLLAVLFLWPVALMAWVEPWGALKP